MIKFNKFVLLIIILSCFFFINSCSHKEITDHPFNLTIKVENKIVFISWNDAIDQSDIIIESSPNPYFGFSEDTTGFYENSTWFSAAFEDKKFFKVINSESREIEQSVVIGYIKYDSHYFDYDNYLSLSYIALSLDAGLKSASELGEYLQSCDQVREWDASNQDWMICENIDGIWTNDFEVFEGHCYMVSLTDTIDIYIAGKLPEPISYNLITTETTNLNFIMVPLNSDFCFASDLGDNIGVCDVVNY